MATIGTVTQTLEGTTWEVDVSDLATGSQTFTVSDGTDTFLVEVEVPVVLLAGALSGSGSLAPAAWTTSQGLPLRDATTRKWCPLRYTANGNPLWIRRV